MIQAAIQKLLDGHDLGRGEAHAVISEIMDGEATPAQISGFLVRAGSIRTSSGWGSSGPRCGPWSSARGR